MKATQEQLNLISELLENDDDLFLAIESKIQFICETLNIEVQLTHSISIANEAEEKDELTYFYTLLSSNDHMYAIKDSRITDNYDSIDCMVDELKEENNNITEVIILEKQEWDEMQDNCWNHKLGRLLTTE